MFCHISQRKLSDLSASLETVATRKRIPYIGAFELTYRCNQSCCHCYCNLALDDKRKKDELSTAEIKRILDQTADAGCLWLLLTGGEVLVRDDFAEIYLHALRRGMIAQVFTNAALIDDAVASLFAEFSPIGVDISIYGSNPTLHDRITGVKGSFGRTMDGIACLKKHKVKFSMKTILMTLNYPDLKAMQELAASLGAKFHFDSVLSPRTDGGMSPVRYRLDTDRMTGLDIDREEDFKICSEIFDNFWKKDPKNMYACGAGIYAFNINPFGALSPCTMFSSFQYSLRKDSFQNAWEKMTAEYGSRQNDLLPNECRSCSMLFLCARCAASAEAETGSVQKKVDYLCEYAKCLERKFFEKKRRMQYEKEAV